jgi:hypothetical protein
MKFAIGFMFGVIVPSVLAYGVYLDLGSVSLSLSLLYIMYIVGLAMSYAYQAMEMVKSNSILKM